LSPDAALVLVVNKTDITYCHAMYAMLLSKKAVLFQKKCDTRLITDGLQYRTHPPYSAHCVFQKSKAVPLHTMVAPGGERIYSSYSFLTSALDGCEWSALRHGRALSRGKDPRYPFYRRVGGPQNRFGHRGYGKILFPLSGIEPQTRPASACVMRVPVSLTS
jgi:hypothetical protein